MSASQVQTADRVTLGCIKGVGEKRLNAILAYRKNHKIVELGDLLNVYGIGSGIIRNIREDVKKRSCLIKKSGQLSRDSNGTKRVRRAIGAK
jgi:hypothetical protein